MTTPTVPVKLILTVAAMAAICAIYTEILFHYSDYPLNYHPDEPSKLMQIMTSKRNFFHPQLLLEVNTHARLWLGLADLSDVAIMARLISNITAGIAGFCFAMAALVIYNKAVPAVMALAAALCSPPLFVAGLYVKEDIFLIASLALAILFSAIILRNKNSKSAYIGLGISCALVVSSKYVGLIPAILILLYMPFAGFALQQRKSLLKWSVSAFIVVMMIINIRSLWYFSKFITGITREIHHVSGDHIGISQPFYSPFYFDAILANFGAVAIAAMFVGAILFLSTIRRPLSLPQKLDTSKNRVFGAYRRW